MIDSGEIRGIFIGSKFPRSLSRVLGLNVTALVHALWISLPGILPTTRTRKLRPSGIFWMDPEVSRPIFTRFTVASLAGFNSLLPARSKTISMKNSRQSSVLLHFNSSAGHGCQGHEKPWNPTSSRGQPNCFFLLGKNVSSYPFLSCSENQYKIPSILRTALPSPPDFKEQKATALLTPTVVDESFSKRYVELISSAKLCAMS